MNPIASPVTLLGGHCEFRPAERQLLINGEPSKLGARAFDLLAVLVERHDRTVSKDELLDAVWPGRVVEENNLQVHISALRKLLGPQVIATIPGRGYRLTAVVQGGVSRADSPSATGTAPAEVPGATGNLPLTPPELIGREAELDALDRLLADQRLVTVTGPGGIGKTRLATAVAHVLRTRWGEGTWLVDLSAVVDAAQVPGAVVRAIQLALPGRAAVPDELAEALRHARLLLLLDNCEHLLGACAELATCLLDRCPGVQLLATSQEPLHLAAEQVFRLDPLAVPSGDAGRPAASGALALFLARARAAQPRLPDDPSTLEAAADICRRLDGLPLAIEMAAARVPLLGVHGVRARLDERLRLLAGGLLSAPRRQQTMRAALEWSHGLLGAPEQAVFRRLGIFAGGFGLEAAQAVAADESTDAWDVLDRLGALVDKSLVVADAGEPPRYRLLETARAFALERLHAAAEGEHVAARHAQAICELFERSAEEEWALTPSQRNRRYLPEVDNLRLAWDWAAAAPERKALLLRLAAASAWAWPRAGDWREGETRFVSVMGLIDAHTPPELEARVLLARCIVGRRFMPRGAVLATMHHVADLFRALGDRQGLFKSLVWLARWGASIDGGAAARGWIDEAEALLDPAWPGAARRLWLNSRPLVAGWQGGHDEAARALREVLASAERDGDEDAQLQARANLADNALARGDVEQAIAEGRAVVALRARRRGPGQTAATSAAGGNLAAALTRAGRFDEALDTARKAIDGLLRSGEAPFFVEHFAALALGLGRPDDAARALACSVCMDGQPNEVNEQRAYDETLAALRGRADAEQLQRWFAEGRAMGAEPAMLAALALPHA